MRNRLVLAVSVFVALIALLSQQGYASSAVAQADPALDIFAEVSRAAGVLDNRVVGTEKAAGQAWGDYDNDGWVDLYVTDPLGANTLYRNNGDGTFSVSELAAQVALANEYSGGATFVDFDNDGWRDLYVLNWGADRLYRNLNGTGFADITTAAGLGDPGNGRTASWGDYDADGNLDLYVANWACYPECGRPYEGDLDHLYHNNGDGTFTDVTRLLGSKTSGAGFVANFTDYDNDGDQDIFLVNDEFINPIGTILWRNDGAGCGGWCFTEVSKEANANLKLFGMGLASGDFDNDSDIDLYFSNAGPMALLQNQGDGSFQNIAAQAGVDTPQSIAWGTVALDYNNDGWRDLYLAVADTGNGKDIAANPLFHNNGDGTFTKIACGMGAADVHGSLGVATADYDRDGWVDLLVGNIDEGYRLYRNQGAAIFNTNWLALELVGGGAVNREAVGARVYLSTPDGVTQMQEVINGSSLGAGNELTLYFGMGSAKTADLKVRWPDGSEQTLSGVAANRRYRLEYTPDGSGRLVALPGAAAIAPEPIRFEVGFNPGFAGWLALVSGTVFTLVGLAEILQSRLSRTQRAGGVLIGAGLLVFSAALMQPSAAFYLAAPTGGAPAALPADVHARLAQLMAQAGMQPLDTPEFLAELVALGEALFWDPELSGSRDTSCATCHHPQFGTGDGLSISVGTGGLGLGDGRALGNRRDFIPRNAQPLYNLGYDEWTVFFWDGRVSGHLDASLVNPASERLPEGLINLLAVQAMFPVTSRDEMRGTFGDKDIFGNANELARIPDFDMPAMWQALIARLLAIPAYVELFQAAYPGVALEEFGFEHAANALAAYQITAFTFEDSPFDHYLRGDLAALDEAQLRGAELFYGEAGCATCHSGGLLSDQQFHNLAVPQLGEGKGREKPLDLGRARETGEDCDRFAFRTPPLRNVTLSGPWMHNGALVTLEAAVRHHLDPQGGLLGYDPAVLNPVLQDTCQEDPAVLEAILATYAPDSAAPGLSEAQIQDLLAFLEALTSPTAQDLRHLIPASVPSGLPVGGQ